ncbi:MAG TPA: phosphoribosylformylglycinamidine synthase subunit PurQ, partial [Gemmatimonadales bacterium]|nr:phosphoribosylformylglycinamidine synthase subunit PurQ [Gemmatimonadales bacterium]
RIERTDTCCTGTFTVGDTLRIPQAHGEGRFTASPDTLDQLEANGQVVLRYVAARGSDIDHNPNGSDRDIAGICNQAGNVVGFMPHPERLIDPAQGSDIGIGFFKSMIQWLAGAPA